MTSMLTKIAAPVTLLVASALVAGCGGGDTSAQAANASDSGSVDAFQTCLQEQGVELPQGGPGSAPGGPQAGGQGGAPGGGQGSTQGGGAQAGGPPPGGAPGGPGGPGGNMTDEQRAAFQKCQDKMPNGGRPQMTAAQQKQMAAQQKKLQACLTKAGVKMPARPTGGQGAQPPQGGRPPQMDAKTQAAMRTCSQKVGGFGGPGGPAGPGGPQASSGQNGAPQGTDPAAAA